MNTARTPTPPLVHVLDVADREVCTAGLRTAPDLRDFLTAHPCPPTGSDPRIEKMLHWMMERESNSDRPRRSVLRQLHTRFNKLRQAREWEFLETRSPGE